MVGTVARLFYDKGFGFIQEDGGVERFFHRTAVRGTKFVNLREGQVVTFEIEDSEKGPRATDVTPQRS
jgi:CspA family cold shock protein